MTREAEQSERGTHQLSVSASFHGSLVAVKQLSHPPARARRGSHAFWIGCDPRSDVNLLSPSLPLVRSQGGQFRLCFLKEWQGWAWVSGKVLPLSELPTTQLADETLEFVLPSDCSVQLQLGSHEFWIRPSTALRVLAAPPSAALEPRMGWSLLASAALLLGALALIRPPPDETTLEEELVLETQRWVKIRGAAASRKDAPKLRSAYAEVRRRPTQVSPAQTPSAEPITEAESQAPPTNSGARNKARTRAESAGVLAIEAGAMNAVIAATAGSISFDASRENRESFGDLLPFDLDAATGAWGHGIRKIGPGSGDGKDWGTVKTGEYKLATGRERGDEYEAKALSRPHIASAPIVSGAAASLSGSGLSYDVIRGQLGLRKRRIRACFDEHSSRDEPTPAHIVLGLQIAASGEVGQAEVLHVGEQSVRACVEKTLLSIRFPEPSDGKAIRIHDFRFRI